MSLPANLYPGYVSIYGAASINGIVTRTSGLQFGLINQIYNSYQNSISVGQSVMFKQDGDTIRLNYGGVDYFLIEEKKIILIENILS